MPRAYSADMRGRVIARVESGASRREAAEHYDVSASTAVIWVKGFRETGRLRAKAAGGGASRFEAQGAGREHLAIGGAFGVFAGPDRWATRPDAGRGGFCDAQAQGSWQS